MANREQQKPVLPERPADPERVFYDHKPEGAK